MTSDRWTASDRPVGAMAPLMEAFLQHACEMLHDAQAAEPQRETALRSLAAYGFPAAGLPRLPLGLFLDAQRMKPALLATGSTMAALNASRLLADPRLPGRVVSPIRDLEGEIVSFWARHPRDEAPLYLYLNRNWRDSVPAIALDVALAAGGYDDLVLTADPLEALLLHAHGLMNAAAFGASFQDLTAKRWQALFDLGIHRITLLVDAQELRGSALAALKQASRAGQIGRVHLIGLRRVRSWLAGDRCGIGLDPDALWALIRQERTAAARHCLQSIAIPVRYVNRPQPVAAPPRAPAPLRRVSAIDIWQAVRWPTPPALTLPPPVPQAPPVPQPRPAPRALRNGAHDCQLHRCGETDCFCFD